MSFDKNDDVLGQIFDFIFAQQELPPSKRKPIEPTGVRGDKELIDAVAAILENPAKFNVDVMADNYSDAVNLMVAELRFSEDNIKKAEIGTSNLVDIIRDPLGYAKKIRDINKSIRKSMRAKYLGAAATEFVISAYLRKQGFSKELRDIIKNDSRFSDSMKELYEFSDYKKAQAYAQGVAKPPMLSAADKEYVNARNAKLRAKLSMSYEQWDTLSDNDKKKLTKSILENETDDEVEEIKNTLRDILGNTQGDRIFNRYLSRRKKSYHELEKFNLGREAGAIWRDHYRNGQWDSDASRLMYERTKLTRDFIGVAPSFAFVKGRTTPDLLDKSREYSSNIRRQISDIKQDLSNARSVGDNDRIRVLKEQLKYTKATQRKMTQVMFFGNIGQVEGYFNSIRDYWNLQSVINNDFFKSSKNQIGCPTAKVEFHWDRRMNRQGKYEAITTSEFMIPVYHTAKKEPRALSKSYDEFFARAYYLTPASIFRTFFYNGEGFAWRAYQQKRKIESFINGINLSGFNLDKFSLERAYREAVLSGATGITNQELLKMLEKYERLGNLNRLFSTTFRIQQSLIREIDDRVIKGFREKVYSLIARSRMFSNLPDGSVAIGLLKNWAKKGGLHNLLKGLSQGIAEALGIVAGPGLNFLIVTVVGFVAEKLYDLAVPLFGVIVYAIFGIIGVFVMAYGITRRNSINYNIAASTPPGSVRYCDYNNSGFYDNPTDEFWGTSVHVPPPSNSSCPFGDASYNCSQGFTNTTCTHARITHKKPVDVTGVTYFYAPQYCNSSNCTASTVINPPRCADGNYTGQWVTFNDGNGNVFTLGHTKFIPPSNGSNYKAGEPVAYVYQSAPEIIADDPEQRTSGSSFYCWTGSHIHFLIAQNGTPVDPLAFLADMGCTNGPSSEAGCPACVGSNY